MKRHTIKDEIVSFLIGGTIAAALIPAIISEREGRSNQFMMELIPEVNAMEDDTVMIETSETEMISLSETEVEIVETEFTEMVEETEETEETTKVEEVRTTSEPYFHYTQADVYLVGNLAFHEEGILFYKVAEEDAIKATRMAASCLVNRAKMNYAFLGRTIQSQIIPSQYASCSKITASKQKDVPEIFYEIAKDILENGPEVSERLVFQSEFKQGEGNMPKIYNQYFGLLSEKEYQRYLNSK